MQTLIRDDTSMLLPGKTLRSETMRKTTRRTRLAQLTKGGLCLKLKKDMKAAVRMRVMDTMAFSM